MHTDRQSGTPAPKVLKDGRRRSGSDVSIFDGAEHLRPLPPASLLARVRWWLAGVLWGWSAVLYDNVSDWQGGRGGYYDTSGRRDG